MAVLTALRRTPGALQRNPALFVPVLVIMLFQVPQLVLQTIDPLLASVASLGFSLVFIVVVPFFQGGILGMADEALDGRTSLDRFVGEGKSNYVSLVVAYLVLLAVNFAIGFVGFFVALFGGIALFANRGGGGPNFAAIAVVGVIVALLFLAYLVVLFFVQFYGQAVVIDDLGVVEGFKHSYAVVRHNLLSVLGYSVLVGVLGGLAGGVFAVASIFVSPQAAAIPSLPQLSVVASVGVAVLVVVLGTLFGGFFAVYSVAFYRTIDTGVADVA